MTLALAAILLSAPAEPQTRHTAVIRLQYADAELIATLFGGTSVGSRHKPPLGFYRPYPYRPAHRQPAYSRDAQGRLRPYYQRPPQYYAQPHQ